MVLFEVFTRGRRGWIGPVSLGLCFFVFEDLQRFASGGQAVSSSCVGRLSGDGGERSALSSTVPSPKSIVGVKTTQINPTSLPEQHSCLNAIISQNCSSVLTLFHIPAFLFAGLAVECWLNAASGISSSSSRRKRALGSSGNMGIRHRGGAVGWRVKKGRGWVLVQWVREGVDGGGKKERVSWES